jgi:hypothetical protein
MKTPYQPVRPAHLSIFLSSITSIPGRATVALADFSSGTAPIQGWGVITGGSGIPAVAGSGGWGNTTVSHYSGKLTIPNWATGDRNLANGNDNDQVEFDLILPSSGWVSETVNIELSFTTPPALRHP